MKKLKIIIFGVIILLIVIAIIHIWDENNQGMKITIIGGSNMIDKGNTNSCGYIIRTRNNKLIIIDGGRDIDYESISSYITRWGNGKIDYWYITHPHTDHIGALLKVLENDNIEIENLYYSFNSLEWYEQYDKRGYEVEEAMINALSNPKIKNKIECYKGQIIEMDNCQCEIIRIANPEVTYSDNGNDSSMVFKITATDIDKGIIFLGDAFFATSEELLAEPEKLKSYAVQMAHHGQNGVTKEVYDYIDPEICFFNCPEWLYNNDNGGGYNSGNWKTIIVREWLEEMNTENFVAYEGDQTIRLTKKGYEKLEE